MPVVRPHRQLTAALVFSGALACVAAAWHAPQRSAAQAVCDVAALRALAGDLTARDLRLPAHAERSRECLRVADGGVELGSPLFVSVPGATCALAVTFRRTIRRDETCGYDVHYDPLELTGVAVVRRAGRRFRTVAAAYLPMRDLHALSVNADGTRMLLQGEELLLRRGRLVLLRELPLR